MTRCGQWGPLRIARCDLSLNHFTPHEGTVITVWGNNRRVQWGTSSTRVQVVPVADRQMA